MLVVKTTGAALNAAINAVYIDPGNGLVYPIANSPTTFRHFIGWVRGTALISSEVYVQLYGGHIRGFSGLTPGGRYWLSAVTGGLLISTDASLDDDLCIFAGIAITADLLVAGIPEPQQFSTDSAEEYLTRDANGVLVKTALTQKVRVDVIGGWDEGDVVVVIPQDDGVEADRGKCRKYSDTLASAQRVIGIAAANALTGTQGDIYPIGARATLPSLALLPGQRYFAGPNGTLVLEANLQTGENSVEVYNALTPTTGIVVAEDPFIAP